MMVLLFSTRRTTDVFGTGMLYEAAILCWVFVDCTGFLFLVLPDYTYSSHPVRMTSNTQT